MTLYVRLGGVMFVVLAAGILGSMLRPANTAIVTSGGSPAQSYSAQLAEPTEDSPTEVASNLPESSLRESAQRRLALALHDGAGLPSSSAEPNATIFRTAALPVTATTLPVGSMRESELHKLSMRATHSIEEGDVIGARLLLERATRAGDSKALFMLAETYDPKALSRLNVRGIVGDAEMARSFYAKALSAGVDEARARLAALGQQ
jgi:hypothetical protein